MPAGVKCRPGLSLLAAILAAGCAEMAQPPPPPPPAGLVGAAAADPLRASVDAAAAAFADRGAALAGRPAEAAQAAAQLEFLAADLPRDPRHGMAIGGVAQELALARAELRDALGVAEQAEPMVVVRALLGAARALRAGNRAAAAAALPAPTFRPGGERSVARLGALGPLPQAALATAAAAQAVARAEALGLAGRARLPETSFGLGSTTTVFGGGREIGY